MNYRACKGCLYFAKHYGNKDKRGNRTVSNYWCVKKQGFIRSFPKECQQKREREGELTMNYLIAAALDKLDEITWYSTDANGRLREGAAQQHEAYVPFDAVESMLRELGELDNESEL